MDVRTLPAENADERLLEAGVLSLRVREALPAHAGCSDEGVLTVVARNERGEVVTAYLHVPISVLTHLGRDALTWSGAVRRSASR